MKLPSRFQIDDEVLISFPGCGEVKNCFISKIHFSKSKVLYDVLVLENGDEQKGAQTRIHNIDSAFVHPPKE